MTAQPLPHKGKNDPTFARPSRELADLVMRLRGQRPVWQVGSLAAPRIEWVAVSGPAGRPTAERPLQVDLDPRPYVRDGTLLALETGEPLALERLQPVEHKQLRDMHAALLRDVMGLSPGAIIDALGRGFVDEQGVAHPEFGKRPGFSSERDARRVVAKGRRLWRRLPAWPWSWFEAPAGEPPTGWHTAGPDSTLTAALESWVTARPVLPAS